ncbi:Short-chain dehydrogenase/reductase SDR [Penicillium concentricum]|uniref:Short-chain dehydrogenase/reductase SDR n=1 Tax=Penicillium concentricum TaxID=293559 RepID=A0A9W9VAA5_9EURO|nr:Short-chain dehydrogenase/reductase SDR [Penicillium concentricum]KAJ5374607.1 Short-chain dehydrogenase/reductase SDR [Penicillium concentricum]
MANTIYLITGASRGIGRGLVEKLLARPNTTVIAAVRDPAGASSQSLESLSKDNSSRLYVVKIDSKSSTDPTAAVETLQTEHGLDHIDVVIANAGICNDLAPIHEVSIPEIREHVDVNVYGPIYLFQAVYPLLKKSAKPTFVGIGSPLGSIAGMEQRPYPCTAYGASKAMLHWIVRKVHFENEDFVSFVADPGFVQTDMGNTGARLFGLEKAYQTIEESVDGIVKTIDEGTRESVGAQLRVWDGSQFPW